MKNVRTIHIRFDGAKQINVTEKGENNTVVLACSLPADLAGIKQGELAFLIGSELKTYSFPACDNKNIYFDNKGRLCIRLWAELTKQRFLRFSVTGFMPDGRIAISPYSELLRFSPTIRGDDQGGGAETGLNCPTLDTLLSPLAPTLHWLLHGGEPPEKL